MLLADEKGVDILLIELAQRIDQVSDVGANAEIRELPGVETDVVGQ
jgi:hypothetical protein